MNRFRYCGCLVLVGACAWGTILHAQPNPESYLGHPVGADYRLARWQTILDYFQKVDDASDRVIVEEIGRSTRNNPMIMATIATPDVLRDLDRYKTLQRQLADPRRLTEDRDSGLVAESKAVVMIGCNVHATEIGSSQMAMELLYELATAETPHVQEILANTIILLVPSLNPDGVDLVIDWYERTLGTPYEGTHPPELYHHYAGHDNNRDWFMLNLIETRAVTKILYEEWFPVIFYDIHQQGIESGRLTVPPYFEPLTPNMHPLVNEMQKVIGGHMSADLNAAGKKGVNSYALYDNWWNGGGRSTPNRHNMIGMLTEAASVRIASPVFLTFDQLKGGRNFPNHQKAVTFADPWPGGWWRLRDIVDYELIACRSLLTLASRFKDMFNSNYLKMGRDEIRLGQEETPRAWLVPQQQRDLPTALKMLEIMQAGGVEIHRAVAEFTADNARWPAGTYVIRMDQPYRLFIKDLLECQVYPDRRIYPGGPPDPPYDAAGWTLSLQMGVEAAPVTEQLAADLELVQSLPLEGTVQNGNAGYGYMLDGHSNNDYILINRYWKDGEREITVVQEAWNTGTVDLTPGAVILPRLTGAAQDRLLNDARALGCNLTPLSRDPDIARAGVRRPRIGLYQPWGGNADEGWTRLVLDQFEFAYVTVHDADIRAGHLRDRYDVLLFASQGRSGIKEGLDAKKVFSEYAGGLGDAGVAHIRKFVTEGGTMVTFGAACGFAIEELQLPVKNVLAGLKQEEFYCPGSVLGLTVDTQQPVGFGLPEHLSAYFLGGMAFQLENADTPAAGLDDADAEPAAEIVASYAERDVLQSGYLIGPEKIQGTGAAVVAHVGEGNAILIGFRPQHRGQSHGTYRMIFNAILSAMM